MLSIFPCPFYIKKQNKIFLRKIEMASLLKWVSWKLAVFWNFFPLPTSAHFLRGVFISSLVNAIPLSTDFTAVVMGNDNEVVGFLPPHLWLLWQGGDEGKSWVIDESSVCVPTPTPRASVSPFLPLYPSSRVNPSPCKWAMVREPSSIDGITVRSEVGGGNPSTRRCGDQVTPQRTCNPEAPSSLGCTRPGFDVR